MRILLALTAVLPIAATGHFASAQTSIRPGQTVEAALTVKDAKMDDGSHYRCYALRTEPDLVYTIALRSDDFDAYLAAGPGSDCDDLSQTNDDGPDMGTDAQLRIASSGGQWMIRANTLGSDETGRYRLSVSEGVRLRPTTAVSAINVGESRQGRLEMSDRRADDGSYYDCYVLAVEKPGRVAIRMDAGDIDAFLSLHEGPQCDGSAIASDDDSGGGTSALITEQLRSGAYSFRANSLGAAEEGAYSVTVTTPR